MKITKRQLRRIIKEEKAKLVTESMDVAGGDYWRLHEGTKGFLNAMFDFSNKMQEAYGSDDYDLMDAAEELEEMLERIAGNLGIRL
jgi:phosphopantetheine adenylyltransferase